MMISVLGERPEDVFSSASILSSTFTLKQNKMDLSELFETSKFE